MSSSCASSPPITFHVSRSESSAIENRKRLRIDDNNSNQSVYSVASSNVNNNNKHSASVASCESSNNNHSNNNHSNNNSNNNVTNNGIITFDVASVDNLRPEEAFLTFENLYQIILNNPNYRAPEKNESYILHLAEILFNLSNDEAMKRMDADDFECSAHIYIQTLTKLREKCRIARDMEIITDEALIDVDQRVEKCMKVIHYTKNTMICIMNGMHEVNKDYKYTDIGTTWLMFKSKEAKVGKDKEELIKHMLEYMQVHKLRRKGGYAYREFLQDGRSTYAWEAIGTIENIVFKACPKETQNNMWVRVILPDVRNSVVEYLEKCFDAEFPELQRDRHIFSFPNGVYDASEDVFCPLVRPNPENHDPDECDLLAPVAGVDASSKLNPSVIACKFMDVTKRIPPRVIDLNYASSSLNEFIRAAKGVFPDWQYEYSRNNATSFQPGVIDQPVFVGCKACNTETSYPLNTYLNGRGCPECAKFKHYPQFKPRFGNGKGEVHDGNWFEIQTPTFTKILIDQNYSEQVQRWVFVFVGRFLHNVNERDEWQVIPFFKGRAGTGKSTILKVMQNFYEHVDLAILSNNIETKFGLSTVHDKYGFLCFEVKHNFGLCQAEFQQIVSGERMSISVKHKPSINVDWKVVGALAGNEIPGWADTSGSLLRRIVLFEFKTAILDSDADMKLNEKLIVETPRILVKSNRGYLAAVKEFGTNAIWSALPQEMVTSKDRMSGETNIIESYLRSGEVELGTDKFIPISDFSEEVTAHCRRSGTALPKISEDLYSMSFGQRGIIVEEDSSEREYPPGKGIMRKAVYVIGLDKVHKRDSGNVNNNDGVSIGNAGFQMNNGRRNINTSNLVV